MAAWCTRLGGNQRAGTRSHHRPGERVHAHQKLERRGYVKREKASDDARRRLTSLTASGGRLRTELAEVVAARSPALSALDLDELQTFRDLLTRISA